MQEKWVAIKGYEGIYEVSNLGNVRSCDIICKMDWFVSSPSRIRKGRTLKQTNKDGKYKVVTLSKNNKLKQKYIHRLVAEAFIGEIGHKMTINHIDYNINNNQVSNLEIITYRDNSIHANNVINKTNKTSKYVGVYFNKARKKYVAMIRKPNGEKIYLGGFEKEECAAKAYQHKLKEMLSALPNEFDLEII